LLVSERVTTPSVTVNVDDAVVAFARVTVFEPDPITTALAPEAACNVRVVVVPVIVVAVIVGTVALRKTAAPVFDTDHDADVPEMSDPEPPLVICRRTPVPAAVEVTAKTPFEPVPELVTVRVLVPPTSRAWSPTNIWSHVGRPPPEPAAPRIVAPFGFENTRFPAEFRYRP